MYFSLCINMHWKFEYNTETYVKIRLYSIVKNVIFQFSNSLHSLLLEFYLLRATSQEPGDKIQFIFSK